MKLVYISNSSETTQKAHGLQIAKMCEAFADAGVEVELILPRRPHSLQRGDIFSFYGIRKNFTVTKLTSRDIVRWGFFGFLWSALSFAWAVRRYLAETSVDIIYSR